MFYVKDVFGLKVENERKLAGLRGALLTALGQPERRQGGVTHPSAGRSPFSTEDAMANETFEGVKNWGGGEKSARPKSVGQHDPIRDQGGDPSGPGISPEAGYKPGPGDHEGSSASTASARPEMVAGAGVKEAAEIKPGAKRDAPPLTGTAQE